MKKNYLILNLSFPLFIGKTVIIQIFLVLIDILECRVSDGCPKLPNS